MNLKDSIGKGQELAVVTKLLGDAALDRDFLKENELKREFSEQAGNIKLSGAGKAAYSLSVFNDEKDLEKSDDDNQDAIVKEISTLSFYNQNALLRHEAQFYGKLGAGASFSNFKLGADGEVNLKFRAYKKHSRNDALGTAWLNDVQNFSLILTKEHLASLSEKEAVSMEVSGKIEIAGSFEWSDMISGSISMLSQLSKLSGSLAFKLSASATASFKCKLEDTFMVSIQKSGADKYLLKITKKIVRDTELGLEAGITAQFADEEQVNAFVDKLVDTAEESTLKLVKDYISNRPVNIPDELKIAAAHLSNVMGWNIDPLTLENLEEAYGKYKKELAENIKKVALSKIKLSGSYSYRKISSQESLLEAFLSLNQIKTYHNRILNLDTSPIISDPAVEIRKYLQKDSVETASTFSLGLSLGTFELLSKTVNEFKESKEYLIENNKHQYKVSVLGAKYSKIIKEGKNSYDYILGLDADMPNFVNKPEQITADLFEYGLYFGWQWVERKTNEKELRGIVDWAVVWDLIRQDEFDLWYAKLKAAIVDPREKMVKYEAQIKLPEGVLDQMLERLASLTSDAWASAIAASVPFMPWEGRNEVNERRQLYFTFWKNYLNQVSPLGMQHLINHARYADLVQQHIYPLLKDLNPRAASFDGTPDNSEDSIYTIAGLLETNIIYQQIGRFNGGFERLHRNVRDKRYYKGVLKKSFNDMNDLKINGSINMRFLGRLILDVAASMGIEGKLEKSMSIKYSNAGKEEVIAISKSS